MGMTWSEYKAYREKKKKEEEQTKKQQKTSSNKAEKTITNNANNQEKNNNLINTISQNNRLPLNNENANKIASNTPSLQDIVSKNNSSKIVQSNNNPLAKQIEEQNANKPLQKAIEEQKKKTKTTQKEPSTWERIMDNFRIGGYGGITGVAQTGYRDIRDIDNMYTDASSLMRHQVLSTFFGEHGENFARAVDDKLYKWNNDRNQGYNYALDVLNKEQQTNKQNIQQNIEAVKQSGDKVGTKFAELAPSVGNNAMGLLAGTVNPALAFTYYKGSSEASYYDDALQRGMTEDQAKVYSKLMSYVEAGTETISAGNILKGGKAIKAVASGAKNIGVKEGLKAGFNVFKESAKKETANALKQGLKNYSIGIAEEFFQEAITEPIQEFTAMKVAGEDKADWNNMWQRMLQSGVDGALSSAILAGANMGISSCQGIVTKVQNGQEFTTEEYNTAIKDASEKVDVGKMTTDGIKNQVEKLKTEMQQSQNGVNKDINQENKMPQNQFSQVEKTETLRQEARNKLESIKQNYDEISYNQMQEFIETAPSEKALNQVINDLNKEAETKQVAPLKQKQEVQLPMKQQETQNKSFEDVAFEAMNNYESNEVESPLKNRDMDSIGKQTKVNAYQYDNPKVKPYFQEMAQQMGEDLAYISSSDNRSTQKGGGTKLSATTKAMDILHNEQGYSYNQIAQGLQNIIDDKGSENNAISKKIELVIDEQLRNGYTNALGKNIEPNQEYINAIQPNNENNTEYIKPYSQNDISYLSKGNNLIDGVNSDLKSFAEKYYDINTKMAKKKIAPVKTQKLFLGRINDKVSSYINSIINNSGRFNKKYDVTDSNIVIGSNNIEHFYNEHGNETNIEQIDVTPENISKYPEVVSSPDYIGLSDNLSRGNTPTVYMAKRINGYSVAVEVITNKKQMYPEAYYIYKSNSSEWDNFIKNHKLKEVENMGSNEFVNSPEQNVQNDMSVTSTNNSITQNEQNVKSDNTNINNMQNNQENMQQFSMSEQQKQNNFEYKESKNSKVDTFRKDASKYWDNSEKTNKLVNTIEKVINDKGYNIRLDDTLGDNVNGRIVTNNQTGEIEITLNPNSSRTGEFILGHELTHAIQTQEMIDLVNDRMTKDGDLRNAVEDLKKLYNTDEINAEVLADISGQLFGNQEFINNLSVEKPNVFKRIYDKIISLANKITGNSSEALFIKDLKNKWEKAYRENTNTINEEQYSKSNNITTKNHKQQQNKIIQDNNPMDKALGEHTWINSADDIKTYQEAIEEFGGIDNITPDFTADDVKKALDTGKMTVYSSYPIEQGTFVTPSKMEAQSYAGKSQVYSKEVSLSDVAWIDEVQGQYANVNEKYSKQNNNWQDYLESNYKSEGTTTDLRDIRLPMKEKQEVKLPMKQENTQQTQEQDNNTKGEAINWNEIERPENNQKFRKHYRSIIESSNTTAEAKAVAKELMGTDTYVPETNKGQLAQADQRIMTSSPEVELQSLLSRAMNGEKISSVDIAVGERLIQYFSKTGNKQQLQDAIQATAMAGTSAGQTVQALSMLNHQTPQGQATWIQRSVDKMNKELAKKKGGTITTDADGNLQVINKQGVDITDKVDLFNLTPEMIDKIMNSENQEQMYKNIDEVYEELGQQVPKSMIEKIDTWRYFSMLANARTHIRNMVGNVAMGKMQRVKDKIAGGIEGVVSQFNPNMERTKTLARADKKTKNFAKQDFKNMEVQSRLELNENKYNPQSRLQNARRTFKSDVIENTLGRLFNLNDTLLEAEDGLGLKAGYQKALADYITANKIDVDNITDKQLNKARNYAIQQAKEATFHQANAIASAVTQFQNKNNVTKFFTDALLPFKKTPMNVAKAGMEYSPLQIAKSATVDLVNLRKGNISINQYIDNLSKGMTGTGVALAGYALAKAGILKASGGDDKDKEKYDEEQGKQSYSIEIAGKTYSLDWLAPTGIPLFIGAETHKLFNQEENEKGTEKRSEEDRLNQAIKGASNLLNAGATAINPMSEMSMISGLTSALSSYNTSDNLGSLGNMMTNMGKSYVNQFFPTLMGQVAKTGDEYERTTKSTAKGTIGKAVDQTINQIKNKVPGLRQTLPIKTDIWGKEVKQEVNLPLRAVNNFINPATVKEVSTDKVDIELNKLYEENRNSALLPDILTKTVQLNKQTYRLSNKEYAEFTKNYGQTSHKLIENFIKTSDYNKLTQEQKETAISNIYSYAKEQNKLDYAKKVNEEIKPSTLYTTMKEIEKGGGKQSEYLSYLAKTKGISKENEKNKVLADSNYSNKTKEIIYANGTGKDDNLYNNLLSKSNINMTEYLKYKNKLSEKAFGADKDKNGKTIAGSAKAKTINYLNNNITGAGNRLLIAGKSYALQNSEKQKLVEYINSTVSTREERLEIYKQLDKNFTIKNGKVYMKVSKK